MNAYRHFLKIKNYDEAEEFARRYFTQEAETYLDLQEFGFYGYDISEIIRDGHTINDKFPQDMNKPEDERYVNRLVEIVMFRWRVRFYKSTAHRIWHSYARQMVNTLLMECDKAGTPISEHDAVCELCRQYDRFMKFGVDDSDLGSGMNRKLEEARKETL